MKKVSTFLSPLFLAVFVASYVLAPVFAFAKEDNPGKGQTKKEEKQELKLEAKAEKTETSCWRAYGHLIAPGWIKLNSTSTASSYCLLPFGISKKFNGTTTPDVTAPVISDIRSDVHFTDAVIKWKTNEKADGTVFWSTGSPVNVNSSSTAQVGSSARVKDHNLVMTGLSASTTYHVVIRSRDAAGNTATSSEFVITTKTPVVSDDTNPPVISAIVAVVGTSSVSVGWTTNEPSTSKVFYSTSTPVNVSASTTASVESSALVTAHVLNVTGLSTSTQYHFVIQSKDAANNLSSSAEFSAMTGI